MPRINDIHSFTVPAEDGDLYDINYTEIIGGVSGCTMLVNNILVNVAPQSSIILKVSSVSATTGCYLGGERPWFESGKSFISTWSTSNISSGSSTFKQVKLPLESTGTYRFIVNWGDGTTSKITTWNQAEVTHTYATDGVYRVIITGTLTGWNFNNAGDKLKLMTIEQWGPIKFINNYGTFFGCSNLTLKTVTDIPNLSGLNSLATFFFACTSLTTINRINEWDLRTITSLNRMFESAREFNDNVGAWNTSNVVDMQNIFAGAVSFNNGGSPDINNWDTSNNTTFRFTFGTDAATGARTHQFNQPIGNWNTSKVTSFNNMFSRNTKFNQDIGTKTVTKNGVTYTAWDTSNVIDMVNMFQISTPFTGVVFERGIFNNGGSDSIKNWNTSKVTSMSGMFNNQKDFDQDIGTKEVTINGLTYTAWDVKNVTNMSFMLSSFNNDASAFGIFNNGGSDNIKNWNTSKVTTFAAFQQRQSLFNQDVGTKVVTVGPDTYTAWDIGNVTTLSNAFSCSSTARAGIFNNGGSDSIKNWNTSKVTTLNATFFGQAQFNQDISTKIVTVGVSTYTAWDTLNVTLMSGVIGLQGGYNGKFNQNIGNWNTSKVTSLLSMLQNQPIFNQDISTKIVTVGVSTYTAWDTLNAINMGYMFYNNIINIPSQFNQNIGNWNTAKATNMTAMLYNIVNFNQNIGNWNVSLVTAFNGTGLTITDTFANYNGLSTTNYDALLIGWATRPVKPNLAITFGTVKYSSAAVAARAVLTSTPNNWTIIDGGLI